jgi:hypothetical protein
MKRAASEVMLVLLVTSTFALAFKIQPVRTDGTTIMVRDFNASDPPFPGVGVRINIFPNVSVQYVNSSDYLYVMHGWVVSNWSSLTADLQSAFLDPQQTNFILQTDAPDFQNPPLTQFTYYDTAVDDMYSMFWFQFLPDDLAPGNYSFTGTWSTTGAGNPPNYTPAYTQNTITLVVNQLLLAKSATFVSCSPNVVSIGWPVTCTATVSGSNPSGTVNWSTSSVGGSFSQSVCNLSNGTCSTTYTDNFTGSVTIATWYSGDSNNVPSSGSTILTVTSGGPVYYSENYTSVQAAIDAAPPGATVIIAQGFYSESLTVNKTLTIIGEKDPPIFVGGGSGIAITLLSGASGSVITGIAITSWDEGILINNASDCKIYNNIMSLISKNGIVLQGTNAVNNQVCWNMFQQNAVAVDLTSSAYNSTVSQNIISLSTTGLRIETSGNIICANILSQNQIGINITNSNNKIFHNTFADNTVQVSISMSAANVWDDGYPSGGNYWSSYAGVDKNSGPYQNVTGSDGIGDTPHAIATNNIDRYPLMKPWTVAAGHSVAVISVMTAKTVIGQGFNCNLTVNVVDNGEYAETFRVTAYANAMAISFRQVSNLNVMCPLLLTFTWETTNLSKGNYTLSAYAWPVPSETSISDNNVTGGTVYVGTPGDLNGDGTVDIYDAIKLAGAFNSNPGSLNWNPNSDVNDDNVVDIYDAIILAGNYGKTT